MSTDDTDFTTNIRRENIAQSGRAPKFWIYQLLPGELMLELLERGPEARAVHAALREMADYTPGLDPRHKPTLMVDEDGSEWCLIDVEAPVLFVAKVREWLLARGYQEIPHNGFVHVAAAE